MTKQSNKIAFTLCSNNYLAQAKVLAESFLHFHPEFEFVIGLVDECDSEVDYTFFEPATTLKVSDININGFEDLNKKYNIVELNTAVKPFYFSYLFENKKADKIIYLDPDIMVFSRFVEVINLSDEKNIILTPQACSPIDDGFAPSDINLLGTGIFNLGFIALSSYYNVSGFLNWWQERIVKYGFARLNENMFYDQLLINLVPVFFDNYFILKHPGYNMAAWNMHERTITYLSDEEIVVNTNYHLRFFHYSGYKLNKPEVLCSYSQRYNFHNRSEVKPVFDLYFKKATEANFNKYSKISPVHGKSLIANEKLSKNKTLPSRIKEALKILMN